MKFLAVVAAGILAASAIAPVPASAAPAPAPARWGHGHGHGVKWRTVCTVRWNHHRKVRVCRKVRVGR